MKNRLSLSISAILLSVICLMSVSAYAADSSADFDKSTYLTSVSQNGSNITVKWKSVDCSGYFIRYATKADFSNCREIRVDNGRLNSYVITGRDRNAVYYVDIAPYGTANNRDVRGERSVPRFTNKVKNLRFSSTSNSVTLYWNKKSSAYGYQIVKYNPKTKSNKSVMHINAKYTSYTIKNLSANSLYTYNVRPYVKLNGVYCYGDYVTNLKTFTKAPDSVLTSVVQSGSNITVKWKAVNCTGYILSFATKSDFSNGRSITIDNGKKSSYVITGRDKNATYYVRIRPYTNIDGTDYYSNYTVPRYTAKLSNVKYKAYSNSINLSWSKKSGASGYQIVRYDPKTKSNKSVAHISSKYTSYTVKKLNSNTAYTYNVRPYVNINGKKCYGSYINNLQTRTTPAKVKIVSAVQKGTNITVKWNKTSCSGYAVRFATKADFSNSNEIYVADSKAVSYVIKNRNKNASYYVKVRAYSIVNNKKVFGAYSTTLHTTNLKLIASYTSDYVNNANRTTNLRLASQKINSTVIQPGETFSFNRVVGERTSAKGYKPAPIFAASGTEDGVGGGICQVASTMFNTALLANVQIVERHQHSQRVAYVPLGRDAAIFWGSQDFKWKNTTNYPIKIVMTVADGKITCQFYSSQNAPNPPAVQLLVSQSGNVFTLRRNVNGRTNYTTKSRY